MQVVNKRVTKFTTKIFNILISFDMRTLKKSQVSLIKTWTMEGSYSFLCHLDTTQAQIRQKTQLFYTTKQPNNLYNLCLNDKKFNFYMYIQLSNYKVLRSVSVGATSSGILNSRLANRSARPEICFRRNNSSRSIPIFFIIH